MSNGSLHGSEPLRVTVEIAVGSAKASLVTSLREEGDMADLSLAYLLAGMIRRALWHMWDTSDSEEHGISLSEPANVLAAAIVRCPLDPFARKLAEALILNLESGSRVNVIDDDNRE